MLVIHDPCRDGEVRNTCSIDEDQPEGDQLLKIKRQRGARLESCVVVVTEVVACRVTWVASRS